jgi:hypothetical protein
MKYSDVRDSIKGGDIIALSHESWDSWYDFQIQIVRTATQSEYCHVGLVLEWGGRLFVVESVTPYVRIKPLSQFIDKGFYWLSVDKPVSEAETEFALSKVAVGEYSRLAAIKGGLGILKIGEDNLWQCAEFVIAARMLSGVDLGNKATPASVVKTLQSQGCSLNYIDRI